MLFNSYIFVLLFLPICLIGYFFLNSRKKYKLAMWFLLIMSLIFYGYFNYKYLLIIILSVLFNFLIYVIILKIKENKIKKKLALFIAIIVNIGILFYFKYYDFFIENVNSIFATNFTLKKLILPLGISFFTFQQLSFVIDAYNGDIEKYSFVEYATFVTYFPQLIAGPIVTHDELVPQFLDKNKKKVNYENLVKGIYIFSVGLAKKVLIADLFGKVSAYGFANINDLNAISAIIVVLAYTIQLYFDFSGYSDMAIGLGNMINIEIPINFNSPYKSVTIIEFWKRWHITLTRFFRKYIYIPLGGNRKGKFRTYFNTFLIFFVGGVWHGANWTYILWGTLHGIFFIIVKALQKYFDKIPKFINHFITFNFVAFANVIFVSPSIKQAGIYLQKLFDFSSVTINKNIIDVFMTNELKFIDSLQHYILNTSYIFEIIPYIGLIIYFLVAFIIIFKFKNIHEQVKEFKPTYAKGVLIIFLLFWSVISFSGVSQFLYFNF